ncbi:hypothetical protein ACFWAR_26240 [Streptomyces sp. NPDC059917]|uniref:hypothetical protein n=1 Tax=Streptomyces sp. NPDC059917 TaxID=3347002 RepID=UPI003665D4F8
MARERSWIRRNSVVLGLPALLTAFAAPALVAPVQAQAAVQSTYTTTTFGTANGYNYTDCLTNGWATRCKLRGYLYGAQNYVYCKRWGDEVRDSSGNYNHWWLKTDLDTNLWGGGPAYVSAYYLTKWGNDEAKDDWGNTIPNC